MPKSFGPRDRASELEDLIQLQQQLASRYRSLLERYPGPIPDAWKAAGARESAFAVHTGQGLPPAELLESQGTLSFGSSGGHRKRAPQKDVSPGFKATILDPGVPLLPQAIAGWNRPLLRNGDYMLKWQASFR